MKVVFSARGVAAPPVRSPARRGVLTALGRWAKKPGELNVIWTSRRALRLMGKRFRGADRFTDVISFRYDEGDAFGDLYISPEQARINARRFDAPFREECVRLCVHGALHLLGYRDYTPAEKKRMWFVQEPIVKKVLK